MADHRPPAFFEPWTDQAASPSQGYVVTIPPRLTRPRRLFAVYARALAFPAYFGWNWDAFEECLQDLSWLAAEGPVYLIHQDLPFAAGSRDRNTYLDIVRSAGEVNSRLRCYLRP